MNIIEAHHLFKWYGPRLAVSDVSFSITAGEVVGLLGPNGSGKTTILRILTGYLRPSSGTVFVAGQDVLERPLGLRAEVGYVPEDVPLYDGMRVREFLIFMAQVKGLRGRKSRASVDFVTERLHLGEVRNLLIANLSRGYRQRVAIAQALVNEPKVLILDEPTNGLDPYQIIETRELIRSLAGRQTVLVASHVLTEIEKTADRAMVLLNGRLLAMKPLVGDGSGRRVRLRVDGPVEAVRACLESVPGVSAVTVEPPAAGEPRTYLVEAETRERIAEELARSVVQQGFALAELTEVSVDLEQLFLELTGRPGEAA